MVLSSGQLWEQQQQDQKPVIVKTVTLEVKPEEGEVLDLASNRRKSAWPSSRNNREVTATNGVVSSQLVNASPPKTTVVVAAANPIPSGKRTSK